MDFSVLQIVLIAVAMSLSSLVQAAVGFASALVAIPLLLAAGLDLPVAVTITLLSSTVQNVAGIVKHRRAIDFKQARLPAGLRLLSLPIGVALMFGLDAVLGDDRDIVRQIIGGIVLLILIVQWLCRFEPRDDLPEYWMWIAFPASGIMQGAVGLPGPAMVLWLMAQKWHPDRARGFLFLMFLVCLIPHSLLFWVLWKDQFIQGLWLSIGTLPLVLVATWLGLIAGKWLNRDMLRRITMALLVGIAVSCILMPFFVN